MKKIIFASLMLCFMASCAALKKQVEELQAFGRCKFKIDRLEQVSIAGVGLKNAQSVSQLSLLQVGQIGAASLSPNLPLSFNTIINIQNPNQTDAALSRTDWILLIDNNEMARGTTSERVQAAAGGSAQLPLSVMLNLKSILSGQSKESMLNFALGLSGQASNPTRLTMRLKPSFVINGKSFAYPGYFDVTTDYKTASGK